jgi:hypothetical protein
MALPMFHGMIYLVAALGTRFTILNLVKVLSSDLLIRRVLPTRHLTLIEGQAWKMLFLHSKNIVVKISWLS